MSEQLEERAIPAWTLGDRLGKALSHAEVSFGEMADTLGVSRNTVGNYVAGRTRVPRAALLVWSMRTGVPVEWLESGDVPTAPGPDEPIRGTHGYSHLAPVLTLGRAA